ncbi:MAG: hypothetical protein R2883_03890 [Caldisericia bacterium]
MNTRQFTLATHWARLIETLYAAERLKELMEDMQFSIPMSEIFQLPTTKKEWELLKGSTWHTCSSLQIR